MTNEEKQLLLITLCGMLPYGVVLNVPTIDGSENKKLVSIVNEDDGVPCAAVYSTEEKKPDGSLISYAKTIYAICDVLPYLRPMSSMTEEEKDELLNLRKEMNMHMHPWIDRILDFYLSHHLDWRGLILLGLALEAPEGMYNAKQ